MEGITIGIMGDMRIREIMGDMQTKGYSCGRYSRWGGVRPRVGVVVTSYNYGEWVLGSVESVMRELVGGDMLCVVDDCSVDGSVGLLKKYFGSIGIGVGEGKGECGGEEWNVAGVRCRLVVNEVNMGASESHRIGEGWLYGEGCEVFGVCDSDDEWLSGKVEKQLGMMSEGYDMVFSWANGFEGVVGFSEGDDWLKYFMERGNFLPACSFMWVREYACPEGVGVYSGLPDLARYCSGLSRGARLGIVNEVLCYKREHSGMASRGCEGNWRRNLYEQYAILQNFYPKTIDWAMYAWGLGRLECMLWVVGLIYGGYVVNFLGSKGLEGLMKEVAWFNEGIGESNNNNNNNKEGGDYGS